MALGGPVRDFIGYGAAPPDPQWPGAARIAVNFVINFEESSEPSMGDGDPSTEAGLIECPSDAPPGVRDLASESMFEFGSRVGFWRVLKEFTERGVPATVMACALAMQRLPEATEALLSRPDLFDMCCHGYRWEDHCVMEREQEREQIRKAIALMEEISGERPVGWCECSRSLCVFFRRLKMRLHRHHRQYHRGHRWHRDCRWWWHERPHPGQRDRGLVSCRLRSFTSFV